MTTDTCWHFWVDRGGTFTDLVARRPDGKLVTHKLLSESMHYADATLQGIRDLMLGPGSQAALPADKIASVRMGTTLGTNALLERQGAPTALLITRGFGDLLQIGNQSRPNIFALRIEKPEPLYRQVIEIEGRYDATGREITPLDLTAARKALQACYRSGIRSLAIALMHSWINPRHEQQLAELARQTGFQSISVSSEVSPLMKLVSRGDTTVVDAYLSPLLQQYIQRLQTGLGLLPHQTAEEKLLFMQSGGGLTSAGHFRGRDCTLSGPAGGIIGAVATSRQAGFAKVIAFDMGGTSTDVAHYAGELERCYDSEVAGIRLRAPTMNIHTVAAGGGSILTFDGMRLRVGPRSAGASPGPASYGMGGPLTVTDANVMLGRIQPEYFPRVFGKDGQQGLDLAQVETLFGQLALDVSSRQASPAVSPESLAEGFLRVAVENMAAAIKKISVERGFDLAGYALCCFGGAGGQHACQVAEQLGIRSILLHPFAGVLSAYGMGLAERRILRQQAVEQPLEQVSLSRVQQLQEHLAEQAGMEFPETLRATLETECRVQLRYQGTDSALELAYVADHSLLADHFQQRHQQRFGFSDPDRPLVLEAVTIEVIAAGSPLDETSLCTGESRQDKAFAGNARLFAAGQWHQVAVFSRDHLSAGQTLSGPALVVEKTGTTVIDPGWSAQVLAQGQLLVTHEVVHDDADPLQQMNRAVQLEVFNKRFVAIAEQMGATLQNTASSVNIKERMDFSCALFDQEGRLIANAPHIPVHLGSMSECVRSLLRSVEDMQPGDVYLSNSPFQGGTHLPDLTVITPLFLTNAAQPVFYVASRGHHADIGGKSPGSMPPDSIHIDEEGKCCHAMKIVSDNVFQEQPLTDWLLAEPWPARQVASNLADLKAQVAANTTGISQLRQMIEDFGLQAVEAQMHAIRRNAADAVRQVIATLEEGSFRYGMDDDSCIQVNIRPDHHQQRAIIDFAGTSPQHPGNLNAPAAVCRAAVMYVFRCLVNDDIPLNEGCLEPLEIHLPADCMLNPSYPAAVVAGNVETSQFVVDALFGALGRLAGSQGSMNNLTFGNATHQYYETIAGGAGAGPGFDGADAVQTHMTNSRITDPEVLESRFPVRLECFAIRHGSGGEGDWRGGHGVVREISFLAPMQAAILSNHRRYPPFAVNHAEPGACGINRLTRANGEQELLPGNTSMTVARGDCLRIETPGGGGYNA